MSLFSLTILVLVTIAPAFVVSVIAVGLVRRAAERLGLLDKPGARKVHTTPIPLGGGLGIWAGVMATFTVGSLVALMLRNSPAIAGWLPEQLTVHINGLVARAPAIWGILAGGTVLMLLGLADDRRGLPWQWRIAVEFAVAGFCVYFLDLRFTAFIDMPWLTGLLSVYLDCRFDQLIQHA